MQIGSRTIWKVLGRQAKFMGTTVSAILALLFTTGHADAVVNCFIEPNGDWSTPTSWNQNVVPTSADWAYIGYWVPITVTCTVSTADAVCDALAIAYYTGNARSVLILTNADASIVANSIYMGADNCTSIVYQYAGTMSCTSLSMGEGSGAICTYNLMDGLLKMRAGIQWIGGWGASGVLGTFNQTGGTNDAANCNTIRLGWGSTGIYNLVNGTLMPPTYIYIGPDGSRSGTGVLNIGDSNTTGVISTNTLVMIGAGNTSYGIIHGWGTIANYVALFHGSIVADGYDTERVLDLSNVAFESDTAVTNACMLSAVKRGKLLCKSFDVTSGTYYWPALGNNNPTNSIKLVMSEGGGSLTGALLATDRSDVHAGLFKPVAVWDFSGSGASFADSCELTIRYDAAKAASLGLSESGLKVYQYVNGAWRNITAGSANTSAKTITANALSPLTQIVVDSFPLRGTIISIR